MISGLPCHCWNPSICTPSPEFRMPDLNMVLSAWMDRMSMNDLTLDQMTGTSATLFRAIGPQSRM